MKNIRDISDPKHKKPLSICDNCGKEYGREQPTSRLHLLGSTTPGFRK